MKRIVFSVLLFFNLTALFGQINNLFLSDEWFVNPADSGKFSFQFHNFNYLRNTEYFNKIELGRTLFGTQFHPKIAYQPTANISIQAGVFLKNDFGSIPPINTVLPTFTCKIKSSDSKRTFLFGTLEGALAHRMIEPLYDINSAIVKRIENGAQFKLNTNKIWLDTWVNWERFIERGSPFKEQFSAGIHTNFSIIQKIASDPNNPNVPYNYLIDYNKLKKYYALKPILQLTAFHRGGQIDVDTSNMVMQFNGAAGLGYYAGTLNKYHFQAEAFGVFYQEKTNSGFYPFRNGRGVFANVSVTKKQFTIATSYWFGHRFIATNGTSIYQSVSMDKPGYTERNRELLFIRFLYNQYLAPNLTLSARVEPFFDIRNKAMDYSFSVYLSYKLHKTLNNN